MAPIVSSTTLEHLNQVELGLTGDASMRSAVYAPCLPCIVSRRAHTQLL
eukprot:COSAG02_NODE_4121_length_5748_cov_4.624358_1_plen_49_part_00